MKSTLRHLSLPLVLLCCMGCGDPPPKGGHPPGDLLSDDLVHADERVLMVEREKDVFDTLPMSRMSEPSPASGTALRVTWERLQDVTFEEKYYDDIGQYLLFPSFGERVKSLEGVEILVSGYVIPIDPGGPDRPARYVLSANPFSSCFFCGNAGPESVLELELVDDSQLYATDEFRSFRGVFRLNDTDIDRLNYLLEKAVRS